MASLGRLRRMRRALTGAALGVTLGAGLLTGCGAATQAGPRQAGPDPAAAAVAGTAGPAAAAAVQQEFVNVIRRVLPSVVEIRTNAGLGSGVVLDADGDIVTNAHVVAGASSFQVLSDSVAVSGSSASSPAPIPAALVGSCPADDLAVIGVGADAGLHPATRTAVPTRRSRRSCSSAPRTAEYHLHKIFSKLDITARGQLARALATR